MHSLSQEQSAHNPLLQAALEYREREWSIIPVIGKRAAELWKRFQTQPPDEATLRRMFSAPRVTGLAVILGSASGGLACRDWDDAVAYHRWAQEHPDLATILPTVWTPRGFHVYFRGPDGFYNLGDGEYRADLLHYCLLPPSRHPSGDLYRWLVPLPAGALPEVDPFRSGLLPHPEETLSHPSTLSHSAHSSTHCMWEQGRVPNVTEMIASTLPTGVGQRNRKLFDLARLLKASMPEAAADTLKPIVREWFERALPVIRTKDWSESWEDFVVAWGNVKQTREGRWSEITKGAESITVATRGHEGAPAKLIRLAASLQKAHGPGKSWPLSCRKAGEAAGVTHERAARILKMLVFEGIIEPVKEAGPKGSEIAAEYRFMGDLGTPDESRE